MQFAKSSNIFSFGCKAHLAHSSYNLSFLLAWLLVCGEQCITVHLKIQAGHTNKYITNLLQKYYKCIADHLKVQAKHTNQLTKISLVNQVNWLCEVNSVKNFHPLRILPTKNIVNWEFVRKSRITLEMAWGQFKTSIFTEISITDGILQEVTYLVKQLLNNSGESYFIIWTTHSISRSWFHVMTLILGTFLLVKTRV